MATLVSNVCRWPVSAQEKINMLEKLGQIHLSQEVKHGIAYEVAEETGMSCRWVMNYLPDKYKARPGLRGPSKALKFGKSKEKTQKSKVEHLATEDNELLFSDPQQKILTIKNYANTGFVNIILEKWFSMKVERIAEKLGSKPEIIINNTLLLTMQKLEGMVKRN